MSAQLTADLMRAVFPGAPSAVINAFVDKQAVMDRVGVTATPTRLAYCFANLHAETGGFTIRGLVENINYTAARMAQVWPNRFADAVGLATIGGASAAFLAKMLPFWAAR